MDQTTSLPTKLVATAAVALMSLVGVTATQAAAQSGGVSVQSMDRKCC